MGRRGAKPRGKVSRVWSPELAYAVGLIATDGCLYKDGRHISLTSSERAQLETFRSCLGITNKIGFKLSSFTGRKDVMHVQFGDVLFYQWLVGIGLHPHKSKTLGPLKIPAAYHADFLRGCLDGDGSISAIRDKRWRSSWYVTTSFATASERFALWLQQTNQRLFGVHGHIGRSVQMYDLRYHKNETAVLMRKMYYRPGLPHLSRKRERYLAICNLDR